MKLTLFTGPNCSLCDLAINIIDTYIDEHDNEAKIEYEKLNIRQSSEHYHLYATRIPVIKRQDNDAELGWPFTMAQFREFVA